MTPSQSDAKAIEEFEKTFVCKCILCQEGGHKFTTSAEFMKEFILKHCTQARIEELEWLRDNASGDWRRGIEERLAELKSK